MSLFLVGRALLESSILFAALWEMGREIGVIFRGEL